MISPYKIKGRTFYLIQVSYHDKQGKRHQPKIRKLPNGERITSERQARMIEAEYLLNYKSGRDSDHTHSTFNDWHRRFLSQIKMTFRKSTVMQYDGDLLKWLSHEFLALPLKQISKSEIYDLIFTEMKEKNATAHTQKRILKSLNRIFQSALEEGVIQRNPCNGIKVKVPPTIKKVLNSNEASKLLYEGRKLDHPFFFHWGLALKTGMRNGELYALRWQDVDFVTNLISVNWSWTSKDGYHSTKSNFCRKVPISEDLKILLIEIKNKGMHTAEFKKSDGSTILIEDLVLPRSTQWRHGEQAKILQLLCDVIGITKVDFHDLRATFITNLLSQGVSLATVMSIVGHAQTSTTDEYLRMAGVDIMGATEKLAYSLPGAHEDNVVQLRGGNL